MLSRPRPSEVCHRLLAALEASEGRRRHRKRNTSPDAIGLAIKRTLLEQAVHDDPEPDGFEAWLLERCVDPGQMASGPVRAMALELLAEWHLAEQPGAFQRWLEEGAPSDDAARPA